MLELSDDSMSETRVRDDVATLMYPGNLRVHWCGTDGKGARLGTIEIFVSMTDRVLSWHTSVGDVHSN